MGDANTWHGEWNDKWLCRMGSLSRMMAKQEARSYPDPSGWDWVSSSVELEKKKLLLVVIICC